MSWRSWAWRMGIGVAIASAPARAFGQGDQAAAQVLFEEGMALMKADRYPEACPKLEASLRLDPAMGTEYNLAGCHERRGQLARAWAHFVNVADAARAARQLEREKSARQRAQALEPRLPRLTVVVPPALARLPGIEVARDGSAVDRAAWGLAIPVDPGAHTITARATGKKPWSQDVQAAEGARAELTLPPLEDDAIAPPPPGPPPPAAPPPPPPAALVITPQRGAAIALGTVGVLGLVVGAVFGAEAKSQWNATLANCRNADPTWCYPAAFPAHDSAVTMATASTVSFAVGGAAVAAGVVTWFTARTPRPRTGLRALPIAGPGFAGAVVGAPF